jgi:hypothetical protein
MGVLGSIKNSITTILNAIKDLGNDTSLKGLA